MHPQKPPAVVLDTNVALDWLLFANPDVAPLVAAVHAGRVRWVGTAPMRAELSHMLGHRRLAHWACNAEQALALFDAHAELQAVAAACALRCTDPDDQMFIDLAMTEPGSWLVTRDRALLKLGRRAAPRGVRVSTPGVWCAHHALPGEAPAPSS